MKVPCTTCGAMILPTTAEATGGVHGLPERSSPKSGSGQGGSQKAEAGFAHRPDRRCDRAWEMQGEFYRVFGTDLTAVPGLSALTVQTLLSEVGPDLSRFRNVHSFVSWLGLCPDTKITGGKVMDRRSRRGKPHLARALRQASVCFHSERGALGARYRRLRSNLGAPKALTAMANLLARIIYALVTNRKAYDETVFAPLEAHHLERQHARLAKTAKAMGYSLQPIPA